MQEQAKEIKLYSINASLEKLPRHLNFNCLICLLEIISSKEENFSVTVCRNSISIKSILL